MKVVEKISLFVVPKIRKNEWKPQEIFKFSVKK